MSQTSLPESKFPEEQTQLQLSAPINVGQELTTMPYWVRKADLFQKREMILNPPRYIQIHVCWSSPIEENSERFWLRVITSYRLWLDAVVDNELKGNDHHHIKKGDVMRISPDEVWKVLQ